MIEIPHRSELIELDRTHLRLWCWGHPDDPSVVCLHGAYDHGRMWDELAPAIAAEGYHVVAPDLRGHGDSGRLSSGHVWEATALDIAILADRLGPPVGLVGHSFGGGQALFVAATWPERVRWVVDLDGLGPSAMAFEEEDDGFADACRQAFDALDRLASSPPRVYPTLTEAAERRRRVNTRLPQRWLDHLVEHGTRAVEGGVAWKADPMFSVGFPGTFDLEMLLTQYRLVECPVLVLTGAEDDTWSDLTEDEIAQRVDALRAVHHSVPDAGHYLHLEQPHVTLDHVRRFLARVGR